MRSFAWWLFWKSYSATLQVAVWFLKAFNAFLEYCLDDGYECVHCGEEIRFPRTHHNDEHPGQRYDPVWYFGTADNE